MTNVLSYAQWKAKHANSPKYQALSKDQMKKRYDSYVVSVASVGPNPAFMPKSKKVKSRKGNPGAAAKGRSAVQGLATSLGFRLNPKTHDFLTARSNPFCPRIRDVGYPQPSLGGSIKYRAFARGTFQTNANGFGQIQILPGVSGWSDLLSISYTLQTNTVATDTITAPGSGWNSTAMQGGPFANAAVPGNQNFTFMRLNALGVRIRSDAQLMQKAGSIKTYCLPFIDTDAYTITGAQLLTTYAKYCSWHQGNTADTPWYSAVWSPAYPLLPQRAAPTDLDSWQQEGGSFAVNTITGQQASSTMGILVSGVGGVQSFDFEVVGFYELYGAAMIGSSFTTPTYADPLGKAVVEAVTGTTALNAMGKTDTGAVSATNILSAVGTAAKAVSGVVDLPSMFKSMLGGGSPATSEAVNPVAAPALEGAVTDTESLWARLAALKMPSVPGSSITSELSSNIPEALEVLAL